MSMKFFDYIITNMPNSRLAEVAENLVGLEDLDAIKISAKDVFAVITTESLNISTSYLLLKDGSNLIYIGASSPYAIFQGFSVLKSKNILVKPAILRLKLSNALIIKTDERHINIILSEDKAYTSKDLSNSEKALHVLGVAYNLQLLESLSTEYAMIFADSATRSLLEHLEMLR